MKKILIAILVAILAISLISCNENNKDDETTTTNTTNPPETEPVEVDPNPDENDNEIEDEDDIDLSNVTVDSSLSDIIKKIYDGVNLAETYESEITADNVMFFLGLEDESMYTEALASEAFINVIPHSVCLVRVAEGQDVEEVKTIIEENANPNKWVCVMADTVIVDNIDNLVILIMDNNETAEQIHENFLNLA